MFRVITTERLRDLERQAAELERVRRFAKRQDRKMDGTGPDHTDSRPPEGDDWNDLARELGTFATE